LGAPPFFAQRLRAQPAIRDYDWHREMTVAAMAVAANDAPRLERASLGKRRPIAKGANSPLRQTVIQQLNRITVQIPCFEHDLFGKPASTFPDHVLAAGLSAVRKQGDPQWSESSASIISC
jgi:hypothetical protein